MKNFLDWKKGVTQDNLPFRSYAKLIAKSAYLKKKLSVKHTFYDVFVKSYSASKGQYWQSYSPKQKFEVESVY